MTTPLHITTGRAVDGVARLSAVGEIDLTNAAEFATRLRDALGDGSARLLVDLTRVEYLDSAALATLFAHAERLDIRISPLNEALLTFSGLDQLAAVEVVAEDVGA
ncbi:STAS domain-containing protein [Dactylosporangium sp. CA-139114]|uniref:STAS domain-containing protein n=1 Tax=Dactylosporangium sp. CA-139114 TaxID=3239931 RepID=UPI003D9842C3